MTSNDDQRPRFAIGHIGLPGTDIALLGQFYTAIGMRPIAQTDRMAILELRGGTHLVISEGAPGTSTLDLMVDDLDETRHIFEAIGAAPGTVVHGNPHNSFTVADPEGNTLVVESSHATGPV